MNKVCWDGVFYRWLGDDGLFTGKVALKDSSDGVPRQPDHMFSDKYQEEDARHVEQTVDGAKSGAMHLKVEALLVTAHFLKEGWPIPQSLADYMSTILTDAAVAFGHTRESYNEKPEKTYAAVSKALGLVLPKGAPNKKNRDQFIHNYVKWSMQLPPETSLRQAALRAVQAFDGSPGISEERNVRHIFNKYEKEHGGKLACPSMFVFLFVDPTWGPDGLVFKDEGFIDCVISYIDESYGRKEMVEQLLKIKRNRDK